MMSSTLHDLKEVARGAPGRDVLAMSRLLVAAAAQLDNEFFRWMQESRLPLGEPSPANRSEYDPRVTEAFLMRLEGVRQTVFADHADRLKHSVAKSLKSIKAASADGPDALLALREDIQRVMSVFLDAAEEIHVAD